MNPTNSSQALQQLQSAQQATQDPNTILQQQQQSLGVPGAQQTVTGLRGAIDNTTKLLSQVAPSVMGRTANSLVTNAQATRQIGNEQAPISQTLNAQTGKYNQATSDLTSLQQQAKDAANGIYTGQQNKLSYLDNLYKTLYGQEQDASRATQDQANKDREYQLQAAAASRANSKASAPTKEDVASHIVGQFNSLRGRDGYVSNETWANALNDFTAMGGTPRQFFQNYGQYVNPKFKTSYAGWVNR